jgi:hypothetical protein
MANGDDQLWAAVQAVLRPYQAGLVFDVLCDKLLDRDRSLQHEGESLDDFKERLQRLLVAKGLLSGEYDRSDVSLRVRVDGDGLPRPAPSEGGGLSLSGGGAPTLWQRLVAGVGLETAQRWMRKYGPRTPAALSLGGGPPPRPGGPSPARVAEINDERLRGFGVPAAAPVSLSLDDGLDEASDNAGSWGGSSSAWPADVTPERARQVAEEMMVTIGVRPGRRT